MLQRRGKLADAVEAFRAAAGHAPRWVEPQTNLGVALLGLERYDAAQKALQAAIAIDAAHASAHGNLGAVYLRAGCPMAAEQATCEAIRLAPNEHRWITNLAVALQMQGRHAETEVCYRHALTLRPDYASGHGNLLFALNYREDLSAEAIFAEYQAWDARHARGLSQGVPFDIDRTEGRRLRVGFVSPDFRPTPSPCSPSRCWQRSTVTPWNCSSTPKSRWRTLPLPASGRLPTTGGRRSALATTTWRR